MRKLSLVAMLAMLATAPALGQQGRSGTSQKPIDVGPFTPEANSAYQGGGVILEGAPGAPAPKPTPPGQTPRNMVPVK